jgi:hypothetical protein
MKHTLIILIIILLIGVSCEKKNSPFTDIPVIESYLSPGDFPVVKISRQIPFSSDVDYAPDDINNLVVNLISGDLNHTLSSSGNGIYSDSIFKVDEADYKLSFVYNSKSVTATTSVPYKPVDFTISDDKISVMRMTSGSMGQMGSFQMPEPVYLTWTNDDDSYYIVVIECMEADPDPVRDLSDTIPEGGFMFRKRPTNSQGIEIRPQEFQYFGKHRIILFHVLPDYASLYDESESSSQNLTNPSSSITNGYGIFTGMNSDTLFVQVNESAR